MISNATHTIYKVWLGRRYCDDVLCIKNGSEDSYGSAWGGQMSGDVLPSPCLVQQCSCMVADSLPDAESPSCSRALPPPL